MDVELRVYFPLQFDDTDNAEFYFNILKSIEAETDAIIDPDKEERAREVRSRTDEYFALINKPKLFVNSPDGYMVQMDNLFEELVCVVEDNGTHGAKSMTVYEFFTRASYCEKKYKKTASL